MAAARGTAGSLQFDFCASGAAKCLRPAETTMSAPGFGRVGSPCCIDDDDDDDGGTGCFQSDSFTRAVIPAKEGVSPAVVERT